VQQLEIVLCEQRLLEQESVVQALLSLHCVKEVQQLAIVVCEQTPLEQLSVVQALLSLQFVAWFAVVH
jgi:hypothetical protein